MARELIRQAKEAGADIAKFQLGWRDGQGEINQITPAIIDDLLQWCQFVEIELMFSIITANAWNMLQPYPMKNYKIASRTVKDNLPLVREIVATGRKTYVSLGMWEKPGLPLDPAHNISYLWCRSKYPCAPEDLTDLPKQFAGTPYLGYSDHALGIETALLAISRGAKVVEKHFTLDKSDTTIRDHALSATPDEFRQMVQLGRTMHKYLAAGV